MYFIEILSKVLNNKNLLKLKLFNPKKNSENPDETKCEHVFVPIDSTGKVFACINCGFVINKNNEKNAEDRK